MAPSPARRSARSSTRSCAAALLTSETFSHFQLVIAGALLLVIVLFAPGGLMGWIYRRWPRCAEVLQ